MLVLILGLLAMNSDGNLLNNPAWENDFAEWNWAGAPFKVSRTEDADGVYVVLSTPMDAQVFFIYFHITVNALHTEQIAKEFYMRFLCNHHMGVLFFFVKST